MSPSALPPARALRAGAAPATTLLAATRMPVVAACGRPSHPCQKRVCAINSTGCAICVSLSAMISVYDQIRYCSINQTDPDSLKCIYTAPATLCKLFDPWLAGVNEHFARGAARRQADAVLLAATAFGHCRPTGRPQCRRVEEYTTPAQTMYASPMMPRLLPPPARLGCFAPPQATPGAP